MLATGIGLGVLAFFLGTGGVAHAICVVGENGQDITIEAVRLSRTLFITAAITAVIAAWCIWLALKGIIGGG